MIRLSEESMPQDGPKLGVLHQTAKSWMQRKLKMLFSEEERETAFVLIWRRFEWSVKKI